MFPRTRIVAAAARAFSVLFGPAFLGAVAALLLAGTAVEAPADTHRLNWARMHPHVSGTRVSTGIDITAFTNSGRDGAIVLPLTPSVTNGELELGIQQSTSSLVASSPHTAVAKPGADTRYIVDLGVAAIEDSREKLQLRTLMQPIRVAFTTATAGGGESINYTITVTPTPVLLTALRAVASATTTYTSGRAKDVADGAVFSVSPAFTPATLTYRVDLPYLVEKIKLPAEVYGAAAVGRVRIVAPDNTKIVATPAVTHIDYPAGGFGDDIDAVDRANLPELDVSGAAAVNYNIALELQDSNAIDSRTYTLAIRRAVETFPPGKPAAPTLAVNTATTVTDLTATWTEPDDPYADVAGVTLQPVTHYRIRWRVSPDGNWRDDTGNNDAGRELTKVLTHTIDKNLPFARIDVQVAAVNSEGRSDWSDSATSPALRPPPPQAAYATAVTGSGNAAVAHIDVTWPLTATISETGFVQTLPDFRYGVQFRKPGENWPSAAALDNTKGLPAGITRTGAFESGAAGGTLRYSGFAADERYEARAYYIFYDALAGTESAGPFSTPVQISFAELTAAPVLRAQSFATGVDASWTIPANLFANHFLLEWKKSSDTNFESVQLPFSARAHRLTGLESGAEYTLRIKAVNAHGESPAAEARTTPGTPNAPANLTAVSADGALNLSWDAPAGAITAYRLRWAARATPQTWLNSGGAAGQAPTPTPTATTHTISGLTNATDYVIAVAAVNAIGAGRFSGTVTAAPGAAFAVADIADLRLHTGAAVGARGALPVAAGQNPPFTYALPGLPAGLQFRANPPAIFGTPTAAAETSMVYTATDSASPTPGTVSKNFTISAKAPPSVAKPGDVTLAIGEAVTLTTLPALGEATGGFGTLVYKIEGALPSGLAFNDGSRVISGTPNAAGRFALVYVVEDELSAVGGVVARQPFEIHVTSGATASAPVLHGSRDSAALTLTWAAPESSTPIVGYRVRWASSPDLNAWLNGAGADGNTIGVVNRYQLPVADADTIYRFQAAAINDEGTGFWSEPYLSAPTLEFTAEIADAHFHTAQTGRALQLPPARGGIPPYTYALTGAPAGMQFNAETRMLTGTPTAQSSPQEFSLAYRVTEGSGSLTRRFTLTALSVHLDVDASAKTTAQDGILIARYLLGVRGGTLEDGQSAADPADIAAQIDIARETLALDVDADGAVTATDGLLIARYLLGLTGAALADSIAPSADDAAITAIESKVRALQSNQPAAQ